MTLIDIIRCFPNDVKAARYLLLSADKPIHRPLKQIVESDSAPKKLKTMYSTANTLVKNGQLNSIQINGKTMAVQTTEQGRNCLNCLRQLETITADDAPPEPSNHPGCAIWAYDPYR